MEEFTTLEVEPGTEIEAERELYSQGHCYIAKDRRRQYCILAQRLRACQLAISDATGEGVNLASLYECSRRKQKCGHHMSWNVEKVNVEKLSDISTHRFGTVLICAAQPTAWRATLCSEQSRH